MLKFIYHEDYLTDYYTSIAEGPQRISVIHNRLKDHYEVITPTPAAKEDILLVHTREHLEQVQREGKELYDTALLAAGGALCGAHRACEGTPCFAVIRPPGHHAGRSRYGGFCFFNNMALAVASTLHAHKVRKAVIVDFDMHRGDGTADIFAENRSVSIIDIWANERQHYLDLLLEAVENIPPVDLIAICAGFDLYVRDWGGLLETRDFHLIGQALHRAGKDKANGRYFAILEGGYYLNDLGRNVLAFCRGLEGKQDV